MAPLIRKAGRGRNNTSSRKSYRQALWFRPQLERLEDRTLLSAPGTVIGEFNNGPIALAGQGLSAAIVNQALGNLNLPPLVNQSIATALVGVSTDIQTPFFSSDLTGTTWSGVQSQLQSAGFKIDDSPVINADGSWSPNGDNNYFEVTWSQTSNPPAVLVAGNTGIPYLDENGGVFGALNANASVTFTVTMGVDDAGFFILATNHPGNQSVSGSTLNANLTASGTLSGALNIPGGIGSVNVTATPTLNLTAAANFNTTGNETDGKIRLSDLNQLLTTTPPPPVITGSLAGSSASLPVNFDASFLGADLKWTVPASYTLNPDGTWSTPDFDSLMTNAAQNLQNTVLNDLGSQFFKFSNALPMLGPLSNYINQPIPLINQSIAQLTGLDDKLPQLPTEPSNFDSNLNTSYSVAGGTLSVDITTDAILALIDPLSVQGKTIAPMISWTTGPQTVPLVNTSYDVPLYTVGIPGIADGELDATFAADASLEYDLGIGIDNHGLYFQAGDSTTHHNLDLSVTLSAGVKGAIKVAGLPIAQAGGSVGFQIEPYIDLTAPTWPNHPKDRVYLSDLESFGSDPISDLLDDVSAGIQGNLTGTIYASVKVLGYKKSKSFGVSIPVFNWQTSPKWPPPPPTPSPSAPGQGSAGAGNTSLWNSTVTQNGGTLSFKDTQSGNNGDVVLLSEPSPGNVTIEWAGAGSKTYSGVTEFDFTANTTQAGGKNILVATPGFNIPIVAHDDKSAGNDLFQGGAGGDTFTGGSGTDTIIAGSGKDFLNAGSGSGNDSLIGGSGSDTLYGNNGNDYIRAGSGYTVIGAGSGNNTILAGSGTDSIIVTGNGNNSIVGGSGTDTINAGGGNDYIQAGSGSTTIYGGAGNDTLLAGSGNDFIDGASGTGADVIVGGLGQDILEGNRGNDIIRGGSGNSTIYAGELLPNPDPNQIVVNGGQDSIYAGSGNDVIYGSAQGYDYIDGGSGNDAIQTGDGGYDTIHGGSGSDIIQAVYSGGFNLIYGGASGRNTITGSAGGYDLIYGGGPDDTIYGGSGGFDTIYGGSSAISEIGTVVNGSNSIALIQGSNLTVLAVGQIVTGAGIPKGTTITAINSGNSTITLSANATSSSTGSETLFFSDPNGNTNNMIYAGTYDSSTGQSSGGSDDVLFGSGGGDQLYAGNFGSNTLYGGTGAETLYGGDGYDVVNGSNPNLYGGDGQSVGNNLLLAGSGSDVLYSDSASRFGAGHNTLIAGQGNDTLYAGSNGDTLEAGSGTDALYGGPGNNTLMVPFYQAGQTQPPDTLDGGTGTDTLLISPAGGAAIPASLSYLASGITDAPAAGTSETITVSNASTITSGTTIQIDGEQMLVTAVSGNTLTVQRGYNAGSQNGTVANGNYIVSGLTDTSQLIVGQGVADADGFIPQGTTIVSINSPTQITLSQSPTGSAQGEALTFEATTHNAGALVQVVPSPALPTNDKIYLTQTNVTGQYQATLSNLDSGASLGQFTFSLPKGITNVEIDGGPGNNWIQVDPNVGISVILDGGPANNTLMAGSGADTLYAGTGTSVLYGGSGDDVLYGTDNPALLAQAAIEATGTVTADKQTITGLSSTNGLLDGWIVVGAGIVSGTKITSIDPAHNTITLSTNATSSSSSESLYFEPPSDGPDTLIAGSGNDELFAGTGGDVLIGGSVLRQTGPNNVPGLAQLSSAGQYILTQGAGRDYLGGGAGNDLLIAGPGSPGEVLNAGTGNDTLVAENNGDNFLQGGPGNDLLLGGGGNDVLQSGSVGSGSNTLVGGLGLDSLQGSSHDTFSTNTFNDVLYAYPNPTFWLNAEQQAIADNVIVMQPGLSAPGATPLEQEINQLLQKQQNQPNQFDATDLQTLASDLDQEYTALGVSSPILNGTTIANDLQPTTLSGLNATDLNNLVSALDQAPVVRDELLGFLTVLQLTQTQGTTPAWHNLLHAMQVDKLGGLFNLQGSVNSQYNTLLHTIGYYQPTPAQQDQLNSLQQETKQVSDDIILLEAEINPQGGTVVESLLGGNGYDQLYGSPLFPTSMGGGNGSDVFYNYDNNDTVQGGSANDNTLVIQGDGTINLDTVTGSSGLDVTMSDQQNGIVLSGSNVISGLADTSQLIGGETVSGAGIPDGSTITAINSATQITISNNATSSAVESLTFTTQLIVDNSSANILNVQSDEVKTGNRDDTVKVNFSTLPASVPQGLIVQCGTGNDTIDASSLSGHETLMGGGGNDTIRINYNQPNGNVYDGGKGQSELDIVGPMDTSQPMSVNIASGSGLQINNAPAPVFSNFNKVVMIGGAGANSFTSDGSIPNVVMEGGSGTNTFTAKKGTVEMIGGSGANTFNLTMYNTPANGVPQAVYFVKGGTGSNTVQIAGDANSAGWLKLTQQGLPNTPLGPFTENANGWMLPIYVTAYPYSAGPPDGTQAYITNLGNSASVTVNGSAAGDYLDTSGMLLPVTLSDSGGNDTLVGGANTTTFDYQPEPLGNANYYIGSSGPSPYFDGGNYSQYSEAGNIQNTLVFPGAYDLSASPTVSGTIEYFYGTNGIYTVGNTITPTISAQQGTAPITNLTAQFSDPNKVPSVSIIWGDGTTTAGNLTEDTNGNFTVSNSHIYATNGSYVAIVVITDESGDVGITSTTINDGLSLDGNGDLIYGSDTTPLDTNVKSYLVRNADANYINGPITSGSVTPDVAVYTLHTDGSLYRIDANGTQQQLPGDTFQTLLSDPYGGMFALDNSGSLYYEFPYAQNGQWTLDPSGAKSIVEDGNGTLYKWGTDGFLYQALPGSWVGTTNGIGPVWKQMSLPNTDIETVAAVSINPKDSTLVVTSSLGELWDYNSLPAIEGGIITPDSGWSFLGLPHVTLSINGQTTGPVNATAGQPVSVTVNVYDANNDPVANGVQSTVDFASSDAVAGAPFYQPNIGASQIFDGPSFTFNYTFDTAGNQSLLASWAEGFHVNPGGSAAASVTVAPAQATALSTQVSEASPANLQSPPPSTPALLTQVRPLTSPSGPTMSDPPTPPANTAISGTPVAVTVTAYDAFGNVATGYTGTINFSSSAGNSGLPSSYTFTSADAGVHTFYANLSPAGAQSITVNDTANKLSSTSSPVVVVKPATQLLVALQPPVSVTAGQTFTLNFAAVDALGNLNPTFGGPVTISMGNNPGGSTLGGTLTVNAVNGVATFSDLTLDKAGGGYTLQVSSSGLTGTTTGAFTVVAAPATQLVVTTPPPAAIAVNNGFSLAVSAEDANGNVDTSFNGNVTIALQNNPGNASLGGTLTVTAVNGVAIFSGLSLNQAGNGYTLQATAASSTGASMSVTTGSFNVSAAAATHLVVTTAPPSTVGAGEGFGLVVSAENVNGNVDTTFNGAVTVSVKNNPGGANVGGTLTVNAVNGKATFSGLTLNQLGVGYTLLVSSNGLNAATTGSFNVAGPATQLVVTTPPAGTVGAGLGFGLVVSAEDAFGDIDPSFTGTVTVALKNNPGSALLGGPFTIHAVDGVATFSGLTLNQVASGYTLQVSSTGLATATTGAINVSGAATQLATTKQPPSSVGINQPFSLVVSAVDALGAVDPTFSGQVTIAMQNNPSGASLGGTLTVNAVNGVATFSGLMLNKPGVGYTLQVTAGGLTGTTSAPVTVFVPISPPPPPPPHSPPPPPPPPAQPQVPPLLALFNQFLGGLETVNANGTTITDSLFGFPLVETYDYFGNLVSVTLLGFDITFLFG